MTEIQRYTRRQLLDHCEIMRYRICFFLFLRSSYKKTGKRIAIMSPVRIVGKENIVIGNNVTIRNGAHIYAASGKVCDDNDILIIGENVNIGHFCHIVSERKIWIDENVLIADKVFITDAMHEYTNIDIPINDQGVKSISPVYIGKDSWIGDNVSIIGANIGCHCIIGANSVVLDDVPDYSVVVGNPARVVKKYNFKTKRWERIESEK